MLQVFIKFNYDITTNYLFRNINIVQLLIIMKNIILKDLMY